ncbi:MAG TPA: hypothetical protein VFY29_11675 [Terriglobia bacterium]|nr:hypothetical protein [Terriglobia bacterium]
MTESSTKRAELIYTIVCDDVRVEIGNKLSLMGVFENVFFAAFPSLLLKVAIVNHWEGAGEFETQVRILHPDGREMAVAAPSRFSIDPNGYADNVTFFTNLGFDRAGPYVVRVTLDGRTVAEKRLFAHLIQQPPTTVN